MACLAGLLKCLALYAAHLRIPRSLWPYGRGSPDGPQNHHLRLSRASGDCLVRLIAKLAKVGAVYLVGNGRLVKNAAG